MNKKLIYSAAILVILMIGAFAFWLGMQFGARCAEPKGEVADGTLSEYIDLVRETARMEKLEEDDRADDWMVGAAITSWERKATYEVVYADEKYLSFRALEYEFNGGAHGNTAVSVGTICRETGRILKVADFVADEKRSALKAALYDGAIKALGGKENLQAEVEIVENFYLAKDGLHFIYNEYEIACYAAGLQEVVIDPKSL